LTKKEGNSIRKLSKRKDPESAISYYQELGIPVEALKIYFATITNSNFEQWYSQNQKKTIDDFNFTFNKMPVGGTLFDIDKLKNICKQYFSLQSAVDIYNESLVYFKIYDKDFYKVLLKNKEYAISILNIEKNRPKPRKDIACYKDVKDENWYMFDELFYSNVSYSEIIIETTYEFNILNDYLSNYFNINDNEDEWYERIKSLAIHFGYAPDVKSYKENPSNYKGHVGNICELIRVAITGKKQTPSLYEVQQVLGFDRIKARIDNFQNFF
jgi:glutamyl-tRNA synthetase